MYNLFPKSPWDAYYKYRIVDIDYKSNLFRLQCVNLRVTFQCPIQTLAHDMGLIGGLSPLQAALLGIEYGLWCQEHPGSSPYSSSPACLEIRYGRFQLIQENRDRTIGILNRETNAYSTVIPRHFIQNRGWVKQADAYLAYHIGFLSSIGQNTREIPVTQKQAIIIPFPKTCN